MRNEGFQMGRYEWHDLRAHPSAPEKWIPEGTIHTTPRWSAEQGLPDFVSVSASVYISLGFRQFKQHKQKTERCPPFFLSAALHHFLAGKCSISDKDCSVGICSHKKICLSTWGWVSHAPLCALCPILILCPSPWPSPFPALWPASNPMGTPRVFSFPSFPLIPKPSYVLLTLRLIHCSCLQWLLLHSPTVSTTTSTPVHPSQLSSIFLLLKAILKRGYIPS